jgi:hypothetical protein
MKEENPLKRGCKVEASEVYYGIKCGSRGVRYVGISGFERKNAVCTSSGSRKDRISFCLRIIELVCFCKGALVKFRVCILVGLFNVFHVRGWFVGGLDLNELLTVSIVPSSKS